MYVRDGARRKGVAQALLARIEMETLAAGLAVLRLETGVRQERAIRLYMRSGFRRCPAFGAYVMMAAEAISTSVFFEKLLATTARSQVEIASSLRSSQ
jgi:putative acetyltransferase